MKNKTCQWGTPKTGPVIMQPGDRLMKVDEVAFMLGVSSRSVWHLIASGEFPNQVKIRRCVRLPGSDIQTYLAKNKPNRVMST